MFETIGLISFGVLVGFPLGAWFQKWNYKRTAKKAYSKVGQK